MLIKRDGARAELNGIEDALLNLRASVGALERCVAGGPDDGEAPLTAEAAAAQAAADSAEPAVELPAMPSRHREANIVGRIGALIVLVGVSVLFARAISRRRWPTRTLRRLL